MKNLLLFSLLFLSTFLSGQGCHDYNCELSFYLPISTGDINTINNIQGNKCFVNINETTHVVPTTINFNNWEKMTFASEGLTEESRVYVQQTLNVNSGQEVYLKGSVVLTTLNMSAGADSSIIYVEDGAFIQVVNIQFANNTNNYVYLGTNALFFLDGAARVPGEVYHLTSNPTNIITFVECQQPIVLASSFEEFSERHGVISWVSETTPVTIQRLEGDNWIDEFISFEHKDHFTAPRTGYYRGENAAGYSDKVYCIVPRRDDKIRDILGREITNPQPNTFYFKGKDKFIITK